MLRWSGLAVDLPVDLDALATGAGHGGLAYGNELLAFATAIAGFDDDALDHARSRLVAASDVAFMIDAAAVAANFEMMTRVADGTGAGFAPEQADARATLGAQLGIHPRSPRTEL